MVTHLKLMVLLVVLIHCIPANSYRILGIFIHIGGSHFHTFYPIMNTLAQNGHDVNVLSYFPVADSHANYKQFVFDGIPVINSSINLNEIVGSVHILTLCVFLWFLYGDFNSASHDFSFFFEYIFVL